MKSKLKEYFWPQGSKEKVAMNLSITDGSLWSVYSNMTTPYIVPFVVFLIGSNAPIGLITGIPVLMTPIAQLFAYRYSGRTKNIRNLTILITFFDRLIWIPLALLSLFEGYYLLVYLIIALLSFRFFFASFSSTTWTLWVPGMIRKKHRPTYFSFRNFIMGIFGLFGYVLALLVFYTTESAKMYSFLVIFIVGFIFSMASLLVMKGIPDYPIAKRKNYQTIKTTKSFSYFMFFTFVWFLGYEMSQPYFSLYIVGNKFLNAGNEWFSVIFFVIALSAISTQMYWGKFILKHSATRTIFLSSIVLSVMPLVWFTIKDPYLLLIPAVLMGVFGGGVTLAIFNEMLNRTDAKRVKYISIYNTLQPIALGLGPILGNGLFDYGSNILLVFTTSSAIMFAAVLILLAIYFLRHITTKQEGQRLVF